MEFPFVVPCKCITCNRVTLTFYAVYLVYVDKFGINMYPFARRFDNKSEATILPRIRKYLSLWELTLPREFNWTKIEIVDMS